MSTLKILGIESSCDDTSAAVVEEGRNVLSNVVLSQIKEHEKFGGVVPEIASRNHIQAISQVVLEAVKSANVKFENIDAIAVTCTPGLVGSLLIGVNFAKGLSLSTGVPLIPINHLRAHIAANYISFKDLKPPFLSLIVSGGHSHIIDVADYTEYKVIGKTRDDAAGEVFDKVARSMGLPYPGGAYIDKAAKDGDETKFKFPIPKVKDGIYDYSFSGLKTCAINLLHNAKQKNQIIDGSDLAASFRKSVVDCLVSKFILAAKDLERKKAVIAGGVSANLLLRETLKKECMDLGIEFYMPDINLCGDNAAMVASQGYYEFLAGNIARDDLNAFSKLKIV